MRRTVYLNGRKWIQRRTRFGLATEVCIDSGDWYYWVVKV